MSELIFDRVQIDKLRNDPLAVDAIACLRIQATQSAPAPKKEKCRTCAEEARRQAEERRRLQQGKILRSEEYTNIKRCVAAAPETDHAWILKRLQVEKLIIQLPPIHNSAGKMIKKPERVILLAQAPASPAP